MAASNALQIAVDIFTSPKAAFVAIREKPRILLPLLLVPIAAAAAATYYALEVDIGWLTEQQLRAISFIELTDAQIEQRVEAAANQGPTLLLVQSLIGTFIAVIAIMLIQALYLRIVTIFTRDEVTYGRWFGVACWSSLPSVLASIATIVFVAANDVSFVPQTQVNPLTFGNLLAYDASDESLAIRALMALSPINLWSIILVIIGYRVVSDKGYVFSSLIVLAPLAFIAAIIAAIA